MDSVPLELLNAALILLLFIDAFHVYHCFKIKVPEWQRKVYAAAAGIILLLWLA